MSKQRYYYVNQDAKLIHHFAEKQSAEPQGFIFSGMSEMNPKAAAGFYAKNQRGYTLVDGDLIPDEEPEASTSGEEE